MRPALLSLLAGLAALAGGAASAQAPPVYPDSVVFEVVERMPQLIGSLDSLSATAVYPEAARATRAEGRVFLQFVVERDGRTSAVRVTRGVSPELDAEAVRTVQAARFVPGMQRGRTVRVRYSLPLSFEVPEGPRYPREVVYRVFGTDSHAVADQVIVDRRPGDAVNVPLPWASWRTALAGQYVELQACGSGVQAVEVEVDGRIIYNQERTGERCLGERVRVPY